MLFAGCKGGCGGGANSWWLVVGCVLVTLVGSVWPYTFISRAPPVTVLRGEEAMLECWAQGIADDDTMTWSWNSTIITMGPRVAAAFRDRALIEVGPEVGLYRLTLNDLQVEHEGDYMCQVFGGGSTSQTHHVVVNVLPAIWLDPSELSMVLLEGESDSVDCMVEEGKPEPTVVWKKNGDVVTSQLLADGARLRLDNVTRDAAGEYVCEAENSVDMATSWVRVDVNYAPSVTVAQALINTAPGHEVDIECQFSASPAVNVVWRHNGSDVNHVMRTNLRTTSNELGLWVMTLSPMQPSDLGRWACVGNNGIGEATGTAILAAEPHALEITSDVIGPYADQYTLEWRVKSMAQLVEFQLMLARENSTDENATTVWRNSSVPAPPLHARPVHRQEFVVKGLAPLTRYYVKLRAQNMFGFSDWSEQFSFYTAEEGRTAPPPTTTQRPTTTTPTVAPTPPPRVQLGDPDKKESKGSGARSVAAGCLGVLTAALLALSWL